MAAIVPLAAAQAQNADAIKARKANFTVLNDQMKVIKAILDKGGTPADASGPAKLVQAAASKIPTMFPAESQIGETKALPVAWTDSAGLMKVADAAIAQSGRLAAATAGSDIKAVEVEFQAMGKACGACHQTYRAR
jgi:cytochrome c556